MMSIHVFIIFSAETEITNFHEFKVHSKNKGQMNGFFNILGATFNCQKSVFISIVFLIDKIPYVPEKKS